MAISGFHFLFLDLKDVKKNRKNVKKSKLFRIFKKAEDMLCKLASAINIPKMKTIGLFSIPKSSKNDDNYR